jgi:hypothetical protein
MMKASILAIICLFLTACASQPVCRHKALATAILYAENGKEVRIVAYQSNPNGNRHAEPQVLEGKTWRYIRENISVDKAEYSIIGAQEYYSIPDYLLHIGVKRNW